MSASDAELTAALRESESEAPMDELYRRHRTAVLSYARACCRDPHTAEDLASEAFARTLQAVRSGGGPQAAWRPYLLTAVRRTAADWASTARRTELSPDFEEWLANTSDSSPEAESSEERILRLEDNCLVLRAFRSLPERWQAVLWHTAVEEEPASKVGTLLGLGARAVSSLASRAREGLREAYLTAHVENGSDNDECRHYSSMLGAAVRRAGRRTNKDLERHLGACERCRSALLELTYLNERLGSALPVGVLLWGGSAYVAARIAGTGTHAGAVAAFGAPDGAAPTLDVGSGSAKDKDSPFRSGAVAGSVIAAVGIAVLVVPMPFDEGGPGPEGPASPPPARMEHRPPMPPLENLEEGRALKPTARSKPFPSASPHPTPTPTPSPRPAEPSATASKPPKPSPTEADHGNEAGLGDVIGPGRFRNAEYNGLCIEPDGTAVVQNSCDGSAHQSWQLVKFEKDTHYAWLRNAATGQCIDYNGPVGYSGSTGMKVIRTRMSPCRTEGRGQLFGFAKSTDGSYSARTRRDGGPWDKMQLGMDNFQPVQGGPVVVTYNFNNYACRRYDIEKA
ncbi:sigma-70 family RNA polymerase sigma factor [Streptomyces sp. NPDC050636]|uniref:sigma-70 family RNA polymerase sigma factor n=1 Tax=Streptomyces sp. NPDC050636 TaxID=3154510 RepID=UPI00341442D3